MAVLVENPIQRIADFGIIVDDQIFDLLAVTESWKFWKDDH